MKTNLKIWTAQLTLAATLLAVVCGAQAGKRQAHEDSGGDAQPLTTVVAPNDKDYLEVGFSPEGGAEQLVIKVIDAAVQDLRIMAYSFTSAPVTQALVRARHRGVHVSLVVDYKQNITMDKRSGKARAALSTLANAGVLVRTNSNYAIHHDKVIIMDAMAVETGSFNFSEAAARSNSENAIVHWNNPTLAKLYLAHWESRFNQGQDFELRY